LAIPPADLSALGDAIRKLLPSERSILGPARDPGVDVVRFDAAWAAIAAARTWTHTDGAHLNDLPATCMVLAFRHRWRPAMPQNETRSASGRALTPSCLASMVLFDGIDTDTLERIAGDCTEQTFDEGRIVVEQGESSRDVYMMLTGRAIGMMLTEAGRQVSFMEFGPLSYFGELAALDGSPRSITVSVTEPSRVARLPHASFTGWLEREPRLIRNIAVELAARNRALNERVVGLIVHDVETRVRMLLMQLAQQREQLKPGGEIQPAPTHEAMAAFVGANREAVSRVIARLGKAGVITARRQKVTIENVAGLLEGI
jgi:CRP-like cAMP-binding protein